MGFHRLFLAFFLMQALPAISSSLDGIVKFEKAVNQGLIVGAPDDLPGVHLDVRRIKKIMEEQSYNVSPTILWKENAASANIEATLTDLSRKTSQGGTLFFYYSGHGDPGKLSLEGDDELSISRLREALAKGREGQDPLERLVLFFDACHSGSFTGEIDQANIFADSIYQELMDTGRDKPIFFKELVILTSSSPTESSIAESSGSHFTKAVVKAFKEIAKAKGTIGQFIEKAKLYTTEHEAADRVFPTSLKTEPLLN